MSGYRAGQAFIQVTPSFRGWNLTVAKQAKTLKAITVPAALDVDTKKAQADVKKATAGKPAQIKAELDQGHFQRNVTSKIEAALKALPKAQIGAAADEAEQKVRDLRADLAALGDKKIGIDLSDEAALAEIQRLEAELTKLATNSPSVAVRVDSGRAVAELVALRKVMGAVDEKPVTVKVETRGVNFAFRGVSNLTTAFAALAPVAIPTMAALTAGAGALGSSLISAGAAGGVFGAAVVGQTVAMKKALKEIEKDQKLADNATTDEKRVEYLRRVAVGQRQFNKEFGPAAKGLDNLKNAWSGFMGATRDVTVGVMGKGLNLVAGILPRLVPLANAAGRAVGGLIDDLAAYSKTARFQGLLDFFERTGPRAITAFGHILGNVFSGVFNLFRAFAPQQGKFLKGFEDMTARFAEWSRGFGKSDEFKRFMGYAARIIPEVKTLFGELAEFVGRFIVALGPLAGVQLKVLTAFLKGLNALPTKVLTGLAFAITGVVLALKAWELGTKAVAIAQGIAKAVTVLFITTTNAETGAVNLSVAAKVRARAVTVGQTLATLASTAATKAASLATRAWAGVQWLLNAAMSANPLGLVVVAVAALVAAFVVAYKTSDTFRAIVQKAWKGIQDGVSYAWNRIIKPAFAAMKGYITNVLIPVVTWLWKNVIAPAFRGIGAIIGFAWSNVIKPIFRAYWSYLKNVLFPVLMFLWKNVVRPVFNGVGNIIGAVWRNVIKPTFGRIADGVRGLRSVFRTVVKAIGDIWSGLKERFAAPVNWIIRNVINKLIGAVNSVSKKLGGKAILSELGQVGGGSGDKGGNGGRPTVGGGKITMATGGVLPGYSPRQDIHHFTSRTGGNLHLSGGEAIMVPEWTRAVGGPAAVKKMNRAARARGVYHFAGGGVFRPVAGGSPGGLHPTNAVDVAIPVGSRVAAVAPGRVSRSYDIPGYEPRASHGGLGYRSYGRVIEILHAGFSSLYAHLSRRGVSAGQTVRAGQVIGLSGNTGNSTGPHLHFGAPGANPYSFFSGSSAYSGAVGNAGSGFSLPKPPSISSLIGGALDKIKGTLGDVPGGQFGAQLASGTFGTLSGLAKSYGSSLIKKLWSNSALGMVVNGVKGAFSGSGPAQAQVRQVAARYGWGDGAQWNALSALIGRESSWNPAAANPTTSARGLFQKMTSLHGPVEKTAGGQAVWGLNYIKGRYGTPMAALAFHDRNNSYANGGVLPTYDRGGYLPAGVSTVYNGTGKPERILTDRQWADIRNAAQPAMAGTGARITVNDRSGDPVRTATETAKQMRWAGV